MTCGVLPFDKNAQITKVGERIARVSEQLANKLNETSASALRLKNGTISPKVGQPRE